jgi:hypothetical protein
MTRLLWLACGVLLLPRLGWCDEPPSAACSNAREQVETLQTWVPVYKQLDGDQRQYLDDKDRPAELARWQKTVSDACSGNPKEQAAEQAAADALHQARSPECAIERDKLKAMLAPNSREAQDSVEQQRKLVADQCPQVTTRGVWLLQMVWAKP